MKIFIVSFGRIPSQWAHSINTVKHAQGFYELGHQVEICTVKRFYEALFKARIKDVNKFYGISPKIKIKTFTDNSIFYFRELILHIFNNLDIRRKNNDEVRRKEGFSKKRSIFNLNYLYQRIINFFYLNFLDPENKISKYCVKSNIDFCYTRAYRVMYYNIQNKIPSVLECHKPDIWHPNVQLILKLSNSKYFKGIVTISDILKEGFIEAGMPEEKILVHEDAVDLSRFEQIPFNKNHLRKILKIPLNKNIILYCGSLKSGKGINEILRTAKNFDKDTIFYVIGGNQTEIKYWSKKAKEKNIDNIVFTGFIQNYYVPYFLKSADILFMPYDLKEKIMFMDINTTSPLKLFEYMASKKPIISSKIPTIEKIVSHKKEAFLAEPNNTKQLVDYINLLINNKKKANDLSQRAYKKVSNYTYQKRCNKIIEFFMT